MHSFNSPRPSHPLGPLSPISASTADPHVASAPLRTANVREWERSWMRGGVRGGAGTDVWHRGVVRGAGRFNETRPHHPLRARDFSYVEMHPPFSSPGSRGTFVRARTPMRLFRCGVSVVRQCSFGYPSRKSALSFKMEKRNSVRSLAGHSLFRIRRCLFVPLLILHEATIKEAIKRTLITIFYYKT